MIRGKRKGNSKFKLLRSFISSSIGINYKILVKYLY